MTKTHQHQNSLITIILEPAGVRLQVKPGSSLLACAQKAGIELNAVCAGNGTCGMCKVFVKEGDVSSLTEQEQTLLDSQELRAGIRLACQAKALSDCHVQFLPESLATLQRLQLEGRELPVQVDNEFMSQPGAYGLAVDIGTTKIATFLVDLHNGETLASGGVTNPQIVFGEDVISRILYADQHESGLQELQNYVVEGINKLILKLCDKAGVTTDQVVDSVMVGNTVMHHLLAGIPVHSLGTSPYSPVQFAAMRFPASNIGLHINPNADLYLPPNIAGFVGGDHVAMLLATQTYDMGKTMIALDIGTNTEISLIHKGQLWACSCASGPAFEGAHIRDGIRAMPGAIERVMLADHTVQVHTIDNKPAIGICGSGILDIVAELRKGGIIDKRGAFQVNDQRLKIENGRARFVLVPAEKSGHGREISIDRGDINEIQLAKAAIRSGVEMLIKTADIQYDDIEQFLVAGAFGTYLDISNAVRIGMFPPLPLEKFQQVGNAAGAGARQMLISINQRRQAERLGEHIQYVELAGSNDYSYIFMRAFALE
jgi:uncharacterized 2Fe-2S/4Fe-4S cluster protein (DUF4445 family)